MLNFLIYSNQFRNTYSILNFESILELACIHFGNYFSLFTHLSSNPSKIRFSNYLNRISNFINPLFKIIFLFNWAEVKLVKCFYLSNKTIYLFSSFHSTVSDSNLKVPLFLCIPSCLNYIDQYRI